MEWRRNFQFLKLDILIAVERIEQNHMGVSGKFNVVWTIYFTQLRSFLSALLKMANLRKILALSVKLVEFVENIH